jgi:hypothetical protein
MPLRGIRIEMGAAVAASPLTSQQLPRTTAPARFRVFLTELRLEFLQFRDVRPVNG